jgi:hypothetical protein
MVCRLTHAKMPGVLSDRAIVVCDSLVFRTDLSTVRQRALRMVLDLLSTNAPEVSWGDPYKDEASNSLRWDGNEAESDKNIYWAQYNVVEGQNVLARQRRTCSRSVDRPESASAIIT